MLWSLIIAKIRFPLELPKLEPWQRLSLWWKLVSNLGSLAPRCFQGILNMEAVLAICAIRGPPNLITLLISASNYIISGSTGFEAAKACAVIDDAPRVLDQGQTGDTSQLLTTPPVSVKTGKKALKTVLFLFSPTLWNIVLSFPETNNFVSTLLSKYLNELDFQEFVFFFSKIEIYFSIFNPGLTQARMGSQGQAINGNIVSTIPC